MNHELREASVNQVNGYPFAEVESWFAQPEGWRRDEPGSQSDACEPLRRAATSRGSSSKLERGGGSHSVSRITRRRVELAASGGWLAGERERRGVRGSRHK